LITILKDAYVFSFSSGYGFGKYSILINENKITDIAESTPEGQLKLDKWIEQYSGRADVVDCSRKLIIPPIVNSCVKSEGLPIHYLMKKRHYESPEDDLCTDLIFNYLYQELPGEDAIADLENIYRYSFNRLLKSGISYFNEFSLRKDINHLHPVTTVLKQTSQHAGVCYPITQDINTIRDYKYLNPSFYLTQENHLTVYDISNITELKSSYISKLYLEVATNKEVTEKFRLTFHKSVIALLDEYGLLDESASLINPVYLSYDDLKIITSKGASVIVCPRDLMTFSNKYFPIDDFINHGIRFSIGTGWLGEDIFKDVRLFRNRYKELNLSSVDLLNAITKFPYEHYFGGDSPDNSYSIDINKIADFVFIDLSDLRFQLFPESSDNEHICDFLLDNLTSNNISDVMISGAFKVRDKKIEGINEDAIIDLINETRNRLYRSGKYEEIKKRKERKERSENLELGSVTRDEIRLFSEENTAKEEKSSKDDFRIKTRIPVSRQKKTPGQRNLFEETDQSNIIQWDENKENPEVNLLVTDFFDSKQVEEDFVQVKAVDETILQRLSSIEKKIDKTKTTAPESKIELPKNVKLRFGDD
jgi:cytosine/adenosine deaminase-related metal-dependent hydrolase